MLNRLKNYLIGPDSNEIKSQIKSNPNDVVEVDFGKVLGKAYFVKPSDKINLAALLNKLDSQPEGRKAMAIVDYVLSGPSLLASTSEHSLADHKLFFRSLTRPEDYIRFTLSTIGNFLTSNNEFTLKEIAATPVRDILTKGLFDLDNPSPEYVQALEALSKANMDSEKNFANEVTTMMVGIYYPNIFAFVLSMLGHKAKQQYGMHIQTFINNQSEKILQDLHDYAKNNKKITNLFSLSIIARIKEDNSIKDDFDHLNTVLLQLDAETIKKYLIDPYIKTIPGMLTASDSIMAIITCTLTAFAKNPKLLNKIRSEIDKNALFNTDEPVDMRKKIDAGRCDGSLLHRIYLEALRLRSLHETTEDKQFGGLSWRYTNQDMDIGDVHVAANSMITILDNIYLFDEDRWPEPGKFKPSRFKNKETGELKEQLAKYSLNLFSQGKRKCPAFRISEYIFKIFIAYLVMNYNLEIVAGNGEKNHDRIRIRISPINKGIEKKATFRLV